MVARGIGIPDRDHRDVLRSAQAAVRNRLQRTAKGIGALRKDCGEPIGPLKQRRRKPNRQSMLSVLRCSSAASDR